MSRSNTTMMIELCDINCGNLSLFNLGFYNPFNIITSFMDQNYCVCNKSNKSLVKLIHTKMIFAYLNCAVNYYVMKIILSCYYPFLRVPIL